MRKQAKRLVKQTSRIVSLVLLSGIGTVLLMRMAPGYFNDGRELDPEYARVARVELDDRKQQEHIGRLSTEMLFGLIHGDLGRSTQYGVPVSELIGPRVKVTASLLFVGLSWGWFCALLFAIPIGIRQGAQGEVLIAGINNTLLAIPVGALCTASLIMGYGGPATTIGVIVAVRDFKLVHRLIRGSNRSAHLTFARAQGISDPRLVCFHLIPPILDDLRAIGAVSIVLALSSVVPIEVLFDVPGLGQLAWTAALNRDLPVLTTITLMMASCVGLLALTIDSRSGQVL